MNDYELGEWRIIGYHLHMYYFQGILKDEEEQRLRDEEFKNYVREDSI